MWWTEKHTRKPFTMKRQLLTSSIHTQVRKHFLKACIWYFALYVCETWTIDKENKLQIQVFQIDCCRKLIKVSRQVTNKEVLNHVKEKRIIQSTLRKKVTELYYISWDTVVLHIWSLKKQELLTNPKILIQRYKNEWRVINI